MQSGGILAKVIAKAQEENLPFLIGGGHAVAMHGHQRNTFDLDLIIARDQKDAWVALFAGLGYTVHAENRAFLQLTPPDNKTIAVDFLLMNAETFGKLMEKAVLAPVEAVDGIKMVSLHHLLALKCHAIKFGHEGRIVKDADDLISLIQANRLDVRTPEIRDIILKHGTPELYDKLVRINR